MAVPSVRSQLIEGEPQQDWNVVSIVDEETGAFSYCSVENRFDNGLSLAIARNPQGRTNIAVGFGAPRLETGARYELQVRIDDRIDRDITGFAAEPGVLVVPLGEDEAIYRALGGGARLFIKGPNDAVAFSLVDSADALRVLAECVAEGAGRAATQNKRRSPETHQATMPALAAILSQAGLNVDAIRSLSNRTGDGRYTMDYAWRLDGFYGGAAEIDQDADLEVVFGAFVDRLQSRCSGRVSRQLSPVERVGPLRATRAVIECREILPPGYAAVFAYADGRVVTIILHEGDVSDKAEIEAATDAVAAVIRDEASDATTR